jgi:LPXTG-site transpeptidase (sortase) family protein
MDRRPRHGVPETEPTGLMSPAERLGPTPPDAAAPDLRSYDVHSYHAYDQDDGYDDYAGYEEYERYGDGEEFTAEPEDEPAPSHRAGGRRTSGGGVYTSGAGVYTAGSGVYATGGGGYPIAPAGSEAPTGSTGSGVYTSTNVTRDPTGAVYNSGSVYTSERAGRPAGGVYGSGSASAADADPPARPAGSVYTSTTATGGTATGSTASGSGVYTSSTAAAREPESSSSSTATRRPGSLGTMSAGALSTVPGAPPPTPIDRSPSTPTPSAPVEPVEPIAPVGTEPAEGGDRAASVDETQIVARAVGPGPEKIRPAGPSDQTALIPRLANGAGSVDEDESDEIEGETRGPGGARVVPLRPKRTAQGYRSVYSQLTRTSVGSVFRISARAFGEVLLTFGVIVLLFAGYEVFGKTAIINSHQNQLQQQLAQNWGAPSAEPSASAKGDTPIPGNAIARLYIPKLHLVLAVVEGTSLEDIKWAPGHYTDTAKPGQIGNFSMAGHRERGIFWDLDQVHPGDLVIVETRTNWYVYKVYMNHIVTPHSVEVVAPVPNEPGKKPTQANMTMTTCNPKWDNYQRMAVHATLQQTLPHDQRPAGV